MNEFALFEQMLALESIADQYTRGKPCVAELDLMEERIRSRLYRVAVIGEFKRGKSSLVNAIIGAEVLPTDILPMTAAVTRITYGAERRILVRFKDGKEAEKSVEELKDYATKFDEEKEKTAATVREIVVSYPSVFCQNHIDIIDTPGLNDNESMTAVTLGVLGEVDAAMVVMAADKALSLTEKRLILDLIGERQIRHLVFVVTCIDRAGRAAVQDRVLASVRTRLQGEVLDMARERFAGDDYLLRKAGSILSAPDLFGVSSTLAMEGFVQDDWDMLEESRFPLFKNELLALLTAAQSMDMVEKVRDAADLVARELPGWKAADAHALEADRDRLTMQIARLETFHAQPDAFVDARLTPLNQQLSEAGLLPGKLAEKMKTAMLRMFIHQLSSIREDNNTHAAILAAMNTAVEKAGGYIQRMYEDALQPLVNLLMQTTGEYGEARRALGFEGRDFAGEMKNWLDTCLPPSFAWTQPAVPRDVSLKGRDVIADAQAAVTSSVTAFTQALTEYMTSWRQLLRERTHADARNSAPLDLCRAQLEEAEQRLLFLNMNYQQHEARLAGILAALGMQEDGR